MSRFIAWIPARGGSKRLPGKNIKNFCGKPLIAWSIESAKQCSRIESVFVSTDDNEIADVAEKYGARVVKRPAALATDQATTGSAAKHLLQELNIRSSRDLTGLITLQITQPLRSDALLLKCLNDFEAVHASVSSLITVSLNKHKIGKIADDGKFIPVTYQPQQRSQDLVPTYCENGVVYVSRPELVLEQETVFDTSAVAIVTDDIYSRIDIDDQLDFDIAELIFSKYRQTAK